MKRHRPLVPSLARSAALLRLSRFPYFDPRASSVIEGRGTFHSTVPAFVQPVLQQSILGIFFMRGPEPVIHDPRRASSKKLFSM